MRSSSARLLAGVLLAFWAWGCATTAVVTKSQQKAASCASMLGNQPFDTSYTCSSEPRYDRVLGAQRMSWRGTPYLLVNYGNEIQIADVSNPAQPRLRGMSNFNVPNQGDSDYDLVAFSVCSDCRYGVAWYKLGTVVFDLGEAATPAWAGHTYYPGAVNGYGVVVGASVITASLPSDCPGATQFTLPALSKERCVTVGGAALVPIGGHLEGSVLYFVASNTKVYRLQWPSLTLIDQPMRAFWGQGHGLDFNGGYAAEANSTGLHIWRDGTKVGSVPGNWSRASISYPLAFAAQGGIDSTEHIFDITTGVPQEVGGDFFASTQPWNDPDSACSAIQEGVLVGDYLYLLRWSQWQIARVGECAEGGLVFEDGFESGTTSAWGEWVMP